MILIYFKAEPNGTFQVRSLQFTLGARVPSDFLLKANRRTQDQAIKYAQHWARHTGRLLDMAVHVVQSMCFVGTPGTELSCRILIEAILDDRIYNSLTNIPGDYKPQVETLYRLLEISGSEAHKVAEVLGTKGRNCWMLDLLDEVAAGYERLSGITVRQMQREWINPI